MSGLATVAAAAAPIVGGLIQWNQSAQARKGTDNERDQMQSIIDKMSLPEFDTSMITPEDYKLIQKFVPEVAPYVEEIAPQVVKAESEGATRGRAAEMAALDRLRNLSQTGEDTQSRILQDQALSAAAEQSRGQQAAIQQSLARRGMAGSGMELVQSLLAQQESNRGATQATQQSALDAYNRRLQALRDSSSLGRSIRSDDINLEGKNLDIINDYNQRAASRRQGYLDNAADIRNRAEGRNIDAAQSAADRNVAGRNQARISQRDRATDATIAIQNAKQGITNAQLGQSQRNIDAINQKAQDTNAAISGITSGASSAGQAYAQNSAADRSAMMTDRENQAKYGSGYKPIYGKE